MTTVTQKILFRYFQLDRRQKKESASDAGVGNDLPPLQTLMDDVWERFPTVGMRHVPALDSATKKPKNGQRYVVLLKRAKHKKTGAVTLRFCVYTGGESSGFAPKDMDAADADVSYQQVTDESGEVLAPGMEFSVLLLGRVALIQNRAGAGAARAVQKAVHWFGRAVCGKSFVMPKFVSVSPKSIAKQISDSGGVVAVSFGVAQVEQQTGTTMHLQDIHKIEDRLGGDRTRITVKSSGDDTLDAEESLKLYEDHEDEGLSNVTLHLKNSETITGAQIAIGKQIKVALTNGVPDCGEVDGALLQFLEELMLIDNDGEQSVNSKGVIGDKLRVVTVKASK